MRAEESVGREQDRGGGPSCSRTKVENAAGCDKTGQLERTEDELLGRSQHVQRKGDFILVSLALEPAEEGGRVEHCGDEEGKCAG